MFSSAIIAGFSLIFILNLLIERDVRYAEEDITRIEESEDIARKGFTIETQNETAAAIAESTKIIVSESNEYINQIIPYIASTITSLIAFIIIKYRFKIR